MARAAWSAPMIAIRLAGDGCSAAWGHGPPLRRPAGAGRSAPEPHYGVMVRDLAVSPQGRWRLLDRDRHLLADVDWLVLAGTLLAHPRSRLILAWDTVPLQAAAEALADPQLRHALAALASIRSEARSNLLLLAEGKRPGPGWPVPSACCASMRRPNSAGASPAWRSSRWRMGGWRWWPTPAPSSRPNT